MARATKTSKDSRIVIAIEHLIPPPGTVISPYPAWRDRVYRGALWTLALAFLLLAGAILGHSGVLAEASVAVGAVSDLAAALTFLVWVARWRWLVQGFAFVALLGWVFGVAFFLWGGMLAASAIMAYKEYHCFHFWTGRFLPWVSVASFLAWLFGKSIPMALLCLALAGGWMALLWERSKLPLFQVDGVRKES